MMKTNVMRILDSQKISYDILEYDWESDDLSNHKQLVEGAIFKTLVIQGASKQYYVFCIPILKELDLKKAAKIVNEKNIALIKVQDLLNVTGYIRGGCSPIGMKKVFPVYLDESALNYDKIGVSAGKRGLQVIVDPNALAKVTQAIFAHLTKESL
ncbi:Cys-tRNA(Pro) deacylase [Erysipelotrichaceae bacterium OH741_COT-311]|nr:Cys-tRNA(Pro) deacylase [Erysipelotrichaceae bacterium OH741_COT-311]